MQPQSTGRHTDLSLGTLVLAFFVLPPFALPPFAVSAVGDEPAADKRNIVREGRGDLENLQSGTGLSLLKREIYQKTLKGTVWIRNPKEGSTGLGTGCLVDGEKRLVITNHHVIEGFRGPLEIYFPVMKDGELITDPDYYLKKIRPIPGRVVDSQSQVDLSLIELEEIPVTAVPLKLAAKSLVPGDEVHSVAGLPVGSSALWIYTTGVVRQVYRRQALLTDQLVDAMVVETQAPVNPGNSGGPVVNDHGELAAVVSFGRKDANLVECFIDRSEIKTYLETTVPLVHPTTSAEYVTRGTRQLTEKRYDLALDDLNRAVQLDPANAKAYAKRGAVFLAKADYDSALGDFNEAIKLDDKLGEGFLGRGKTQRAKGDNEASLKDLTEAIRRVPEDIELYDVFNERGITHYWNAEYDLAKDDFTHSLEHLDRKEKAADRVTIVLLRDKAQIHANRGDALHQQKEPEKALLEIQTALNINPKDASYWALLGAVQHTLGQNEAAIARYGEAIGLEPTNAAHYRQRAELLSGEGKQREALSDYLKAVELEPKNAENANLVGVCLYQLGEYNLALGAFEQAMTLDGTVAMYPGNRGDSYYELKNYPEAIKQYTAAIQLDPTVAKFYSSRGLSYQENGETAAATADLKKAAELDSASYKFHDRRYVAVKNDTKEPLKVYLQYHTLGTDGKWRWYPDGHENGVAVVFDLAAGSTWNLYHDEYRILADRMKIWAVGKNTEGTWTGNKETDSIVAPSSGYLNNQGTPDTFTYRFYE